MIVEFKGFRLKTDLSRSLYKPDFINTRYLDRQHWYKDTRKSYFQLLLLLDKINKI